ncbi:MAG: AI-2E family transporter [Alphaproteobacteria bacterium]|nr:AI-2E family transporter [Alphaproteobacteria bacterium]
MTLSTSQKYFWPLALAAFVLVLWALKPMLLPFIAGMALAYFLDPLVDALAQRHIPRWLGTAAVLLTFVLLVVLALLLVVPLLQHQIGALIEALPGYLESARTRLVPWAEKWMAHLSSEDVDRLREAVGQYAGSVVGWAGKLLREVISGGVALFDILALIVITPVVAFYLLRDWPKLVQNVDSLLPRHHHATIRAELDNIDRTLSGFLRGQALVCLCLGFIYSLGLTLAGLKYGATIGIIAGILSFIPYVGSTFGFVASLALAFVQFDNFFDISMVLLVFLVGQSLEGYVLTPKLVGDRVGLHPVWILFAIFAGGTLMGFTGVLIAVPVAAVIGVLIRFALQQYKTSALYHKTPPHD